MVNGLSPWHLLVVALVFVILFGSKKLPDAARGLGRSLRIFKSEVAEMKNDGAKSPGSETSTQAELPATSVSPEPSTRRDTEPKSA